MARLPGISANSNENYRRYNVQALADISASIKIFKKFSGVTSVSVTDGYHLFSLKI